jgi:hypothetical protein
MTDDQIIETAIQGHASTRDAIRWAIQQVRRPPPLFDKQIDAVTVALWGWDVDFAAGRAYARAIERAIGVAPDVCPQVKRWSSKNGEHTLTLADGRVLTSKDGINWTHDDAALFNELLNILGPTAPTCCGCSAEWQAAIDLIKTRLGVEK